MIGIFFLFQVKTGYDGLGGRTKFFQPVSFFIKYVSNR